MNKETLKNLLQYKSITNQQVYRCNVCFICDGQQDLPNGLRPTYCRRCFTCVHPECYTGEQTQLAKGKLWTCDRCVYEEEQKGPELECKYCPHRWGAMKRFCIQSKEVFWAHLTCVSLNPSIYLKCERKAKKMKDCLPIGIHNKDQYARMAYQLCQYCQNQKGYALQCDKKGCEFKFHPQCWMLANPFSIHFQKLTQTEQFKKTGFFKIYCDKHFPNYSSNQNDVEIQWTKKQVQHLQNESEQLSSITEDEGMSSALQRDF